jgi:hypothetical protein
MFRLIECQTPLRGSACAAHRLRGIGDGQNLIRRDVINKTIPWKKWARCGNFAHAETFPSQYADAGWTGGFLKT